MRRMRRVKIVATLGPASHDEKTIEDLARAGADVFRINMSHASHDVLRQTVERIRNVEKTINHPLGILVDLQGPKLRVWKFAEGSVQLVAGQKFVLDSNDAPGTTERVYLPHPEIIESVSVGDRLLLDDGKLALKATKVGNGAIETEVIYGGKLSDKKGVSLPDTLLPIGALTEKDHADLREGLACDADWIALSFVQRPEDIIDVRKIVQGRAGVMAKIEKPQAIERLEEIIKLCDAIMVARGDLGVELPLETVPGLQKRMIRMARRYGKPVVVATQMLESMITSPVPTRAEVSDVSIAVFEGADAIMLSAESASGQYPIEAVSTMNKVAVAVENDVNYRGIIRAPRPSRRPPPPTPSRPPPARLPKPSTWLPSSPTPRPARPASAPPANGPASRSSRSRPIAAPSAGSPSSGASTASRPKTPSASKTWSIAPASSPIRRALPAPATASPSPPAFPWARPAPPTCCASPSSARTAPAPAELSPTA